MPPSSLATSPCSRVVRTPISPSLTFFLLVGKCYLILSSVLHSPLLLAEMASTVDLRRLRGFKGRNLLHLAVEGSCVTGRLDVCRFLVEEKGFDANSASTEGKPPARLFPVRDEHVRPPVGATG